ncbi:hypothetical protein MNBD_NITROSPIRAE01-151 [hydrothermal vent metagenome]|uniref:Uncharacterized protein TP-0789 domain-containing protein n=1 Tax=hydrothermal vent metagenome TaxID=652676 RepID=A0A3B1DDV3_9ZZZZ
MIKRRNFRFFFVGIVLFLGAGNVLAQENKLTGAEVMERVQHANMTMDQTSIVTMILIDAQGNKRRIETLRFHKHMNGKDGLDNKSVFYTEFPPDQKGTGFLIWDYSIKGKPDDLWLYLPSLRSVRRMTTRDQNDSFMGSDLTFSDMGARRLDEDDHKLVFDGLCKGCREPSYVVDSFPKETDSPYGKKRYFISKKDWVAHKVEFYDRNMKGLKLQTILWEKIGKVLVWTRSEIQNVQSKHKTIFEITEIKNDTGLRDSIFAARVLEKGPPR